MKKICARIDMDVLAKLQGMKKGRESYSIVLRRVLKMEDERK
jgi:predicted CopG family antitoxin